MDTTRFMNNVNAACDWLVKLFYLNLLWALFTVVGLVVAGIFPATVALFTILKDFQTGENVRVFNRFWEVYRKEFGRVNRLGIVLTAIPIIFYTDWLFTNQFTGTGAMAAKGILLGCAFLYGITLMYVFPVYLQGDRKVFSTIKLAFLIGITYPFYTLMMFISVVSLLVVFAFLPMAGYLFLGSGLTCILVFFSSRLFEKMEAQAGTAQKQKTRWVPANHKLREKYPLSKG